MSEIPEFELAADGAVEHVEEIGPPAPRPCSSCPYRRDAPSGVWDAEEYEKLRLYDLDMAFQPPRLFQCHQADFDSGVRRLCAGWAGCHGSELLGLCVASDSCCSDESTSRQDAIL
ncbi:DUF6283 family protein [Nocardia vaccinii]|uniref:DUF6283 family protein n=1 Tax=Nocardia vaccinii TaxID=1822 RepID=UPI000830AAD5|nr:DUF6283 family protein [Nocardia vaccinii]